MNSNAKGKAGEREWAAYCREKFGLMGARRSQQYCGTADSQDVLTFPGTHAEVKRVEALNIEKAMEQAIEDSAGYRPILDSVPYVAHRKNRTQWLVTVRATDLVEFARRVLATQVEEAKP